jgi:7-cyano-7-deazaguanine synthase
METSTMTKNSDQPEKALVVLSGGQDSTTCLFWATKKWGAENVHAITFDYGQRHKVEIQAACKVAQLAGVADQHEILSVGPILVSTSPLVSGNDLEQYADHNSLPGGLEKTFVPMRNTLFLTLAANRAYHLRAFNIVTGVCEEDYGGYPDCRQVFIEALRDAFNQSINEHNYSIYQGELGRVFEIHTPLMRLTKAETVHMAYELGEDCWNALAYSHTAYDGAYPPTGHDHATLLRAKGFIEAGLPDPLVLRAVGEGLMDIPQTANYTGQNETPDA